MCSPAIDLEDVSLEGFAKDFNLGMASCILGIEVDDAGNAQQENEGDKERFGNLIENLFHSPILSMARSFENSFLTCLIWVPSGDTDLCCGLSLKSGSSAVW